MIGRILSSLALMAMAPALWADALTGDVQRQAVSYTHLTLPTIYSV